MGPELKQYLTMLAALWHAVEQSNRVTQQRLCTGHKNISVCKCISPTATTAKPPR